MIAIFFVWAMVAWFLQKNRLKNIRQALVPLFAYKTFEFPKHRSLVVRGMNCLQEELSLVLNVKVIIHVQFSENLKMDNFLSPLFYLLEKKLEDEKKYFVHENEFFSVNEILNKINSLSKIKCIFLACNNKIGVWNVKFEL